jgi:hypothetical protein
MNTEHPRFGQRLQTGGGILLVVWITARMQDHLSILVAGCLLTLALLYRLSIELSIVGDETEEEIEPKLQRLKLLNQFSFLAAAFGLVGFLHEQ